MLGRVWSVLVVSWLRLGREWGVLVLLLSMLRRGEGEMFSSDEKAKDGMVKLGVVVLYSRSCSRLGIGVGVRRNLPPDEAFVGESLVGDSSLMVGVMGGGRAKVGMWRGESSGVENW